MTRWTLLWAAGLVAMASPTLAEEIKPRSIVYLECTVNGTTIPGSGVVIDDEGRVLSSRHVVKKIGATCTGEIGQRPLNNNNMEPMRVVDVAEGHDVALLQFDNYQILDFDPISYIGTTVIEDGIDIVGYGFIPSKYGPPLSSNGKIKSKQPSSGGLILTDMNTTKGMSGGPVVTNGHLLGIIKQETFDNLGQAIASRFVVANEFPDDIRTFLGNKGQLDRQHILSTELASDDLCTQLLREHIRSREAHFPDAAQIVSDLIGEPSSELSKTAEYWVTVTTGPAKWVDCTSGNMLKSIYFPMGMMVRPERDVNVGGATETVFLTEYGLRVFLDKAAIQPVTDDVGYVFANGDSAFIVCPRDELDCDPFAEHHLTDPAMTWPFVSGYLSYLRTDSPEDLEEARNSLRELYDFQKNPLRPNPFIKGPHSLEACAIRAAQLYTFFEHFDNAEPQKGSAYQHPVNYSLCTVKDNEAYNRFETSKLVTKDYAENRFEALWAVSTVPVLPDNIEAATRALFDIAVGSPIVQIIRCGEPRKGVFTLASVSRGDPPNLSDLIESDVRRHSVFRQFQVAQARSPVDVFGDVPLFNEVEISVICDDDDELRNAGSVIVDLAPISGGAEVELRLFDLYEALRAQFANIGMPNSQVVNRRLREGIIYRICEYREYIAWRTILFNELKDSQQVRDARQILNVDLALMANHLTQLIMASVFSTDVKLQLAYNAIEGCE